MKLLFLVALLLAVIGAQAQPILRNDFTTNANGYSLLVWTNEAGWVHPITSTNHVSIGFPSDPGDVFAATAGRSATITNAGVAVFGSNDSDRPGAVKPVWWYDNNTYGVQGISNGTNATGSSVGIFGSTIGRTKWNIGAVGSVTVLGSGRTNTGVYGAVAKYATTGIYNALVGELVTDESAVDELIQESAVALLDNRDTALPLLIARSNGVAMSKLNANGTLSLNGRTNQIGDNNTTVTYNGVAIGGSGDTTATNIVTLTQTGTNISQLDFALVARGGTFKLNLTNNGYIGAPAGVASTPFSKCTLYVQQPSTGTCFLTFSNGFWSFPEGVAPIIDTNNGAITIYEFKSNLFTNGLVDGWMSLKSKLIP